MCRFAIPGKKNPLRLRSICAVLALTLALVLSTAQASSAQLSVAWNPGTGPIAGYTVYYGLSTGQYTNSVNAGNNLSATLPNLSNSTYYIAAADYDANNDQSSPSTELIVQPLTASAGTGGSITPSGTFFVAQGANQTFTITPASGYQVSGVQVDGQSVGPVSSYTMTAVSAPHTITATFAANAPAYTITASAGANGTISPSGSVSVAGGASQTFTITPASGYNVASVTVDGSSVGAVTSYPFSNVTANHTISATFAINTYTITASAGANGTISPSGSVSVAGGASQTFTITPGSGYHVASVTVDGSSVGAVTSYPFSNVTANHTISATFALNTYTITPSAGTNGTISPSAALTVNSGASQAFTIAPAKGYWVAGVQVDGVSVGAVTTYKFSNVTANHTIVATFAKRDLIWKGPGGYAYIWPLDGSNKFASSNNSAQTEYGPYSGWTPAYYSINPTDGTRTLVWAGTGGSASIWTLDSSNSLTTYTNYGPYSGWTPVSYSSNSDGTRTLLWAGTGGSAYIWTLNSSNSLTTYTNYGPYSGWTPVSYSYNSDGTRTLLWAGTGGSASIWTLNSSNSLTTNTYYGPYSGWTPVQYQ